MGPLATLVLLTGLVVGMPGEARAQAPDEPRAVGEFLLISKDGERIKGHGGALTSTRFTGISADGQTLDFLPDDIGTLYRHEGSYAGPGAMYGAGFGLLLTGTVLLRYGIESPAFFRDESAAGVSLGLLGGSALLGALVGLAIGAGQSRWSVEPLVAPGQQVSLNLSHSL
ncbi:hypothetical protein D187_001797 [Cystobacter fuscus DSM 2262]|uniref:Uncharacterized protein n=1 Tax=Cystobacter fuscus (strain ATCC 25194 / DSM 2262 / NBRC 100088 / M29) TaxID=1242864 RepID=S9P776_CYSF2|nr:hypothetical protein D187_001797 [Cystobacter fuscus DSM 2262]